MMSRTMIILSLAALLLVVAPAARADVRLNGLFGHDMVIQQGAKAPVWGTAAAGEKVTVKMADLVAETTAGDDGRWRLEIGPLKAGGPHELTVSGANTIRLSNVLIGEVWICSGQSNMSWPLIRAADAEKEIAAADLPRIRLLTVPRMTSEQPQEEIRGRWRVCTPKAVTRFSAVGYFFGSELHKARKVPVGLINASWAGTPAHAWTSGEALKADPAFKPMLQRWEKIIAVYPAAMAKYKEDRENWEKDAARAREDNWKPPRRPRAPHGEKSPRRPSNLFNGMIAPLVPFSVRGVIWYEGENNAGDAGLYRVLFPAMIRDWRRHWAQDDLPFLFVQLPNFLAPQKAPVEERSWAELREAQFLTLSLPNTGMAVTLGLGEVGNIHPSNKRPVGERICLWARGTVYGEEIVYSGPLYKSMVREGRRIRVRFDHAAGLTAKDEELKGFAIAGKDGKFVWAQAQIDGEDVMVWSDDVTDPVAVRYAWAYNPMWSLTNEQGLPASPFRTDVPELPTREQP